MRSAKARSYNEKTKYSKTSQKEEWDRLRHVGWGERGIEKGGYEILKK